MEKRIICPVCNAEKMCIEESQGDLISYMCFRCGYMSDGRMGEDSEFMEKHLKNTVKLIEDKSNIEIEALKQFMAGNLSVDSKLAKN